ncbi:hypothetical protein TNCT_98951 [Trichonephila clavata]|uniref:Uncharacterized protein n=1 Tax=Trichonephila clavata TaxID=2740835 RepID=A0A8X6F9K7_TRICU|nr:hypothetical protein TNCT_98951 [Trichonephila clavata]
MENGSCDSDPESGEKPNRPRVIPPNLTTTPSTQISPCPPVGQLQYSVIVPSPVILRPPPLLQLFSERSSQDRIPLTPSTHPFKVNRKRSKLL